MKLKGVCIHDDAGALGVAVPMEVWERRLPILKEACCCNSLRLSHNPHADYLYDLCDKMGFPVMDEASLTNGRPARISGSRVGMWASRDRTAITNISGNGPPGILGT